MILILYGIRSILIRIKGIKAISKDVWMGDLEGRKIYSSLAASKADRME